MVNRKRNVFTGAQRMDLKLVTVGGFCGGQFRSNFQRNSDTLDFSQDYTGAITAPRAEFVWSESFL